MKRQNVRTLSLIVVTFTYLLFGAAIFDALESDFEVTEDVRLRDSAESLRTKYNITIDDFERITQLGIQMKPYKAGTQWKFAGAFYFSTTVITTIGYGHSTPKTVGGKIFCMCYALPGIPLCLIMFQSIGERMNTIITYILQKINLLCKIKKIISQTHLMIVSFTIGSTVLTIGAVVFSRYEDWNYLDSFYYCFVTLTTIGFGDFVALQRNNSLAKRPDYVAFSLIFILFGLTVVSSVMNLLVLRFLTMNTEDEKRDQLVAAVHAQELQRLRGDVICADKQTDLQEQEQHHHLHQQHQQQQYQQQQLGYTNNNSIQPYRENNINHFDKYNQIMFMTNARRSIQLEGLKTPLRRKTLMENYTKSDSSNEHNINNDNISNENELCHDCSNHDKAKIFNFCLLCLKKLQSSSPVVLNSPSIIVNDKCQHTHDENLLLSPVTMSSNHVSKSNEIYKNRYHYHHHDNKRCSMNYFSEYPRQQLTDYNHYLVYDQVGQRVSMNPHKDSLISDLPNSPNSLNSDTCCRNPYIYSNHTAHPHASSDSEMSAPVGQRYPHDCNCAHEMLHRNHFYQGDFEDGVDMDTRSLLQHKMYEGRSDIHSHCLSHHDCNNYANYPFFNFFPSNYNLYSPDHFASSSRDNKPKKFFSVPSHPSFGSSDLKVHCDNLPPKASLQTPKLFLSKMMTPATKLFPSSSLNKNLFKSDQSFVNTSSNCQYPSECVNLQSNLSALNITPTSYLSYKRFPRTHQEQQKEVNEENEYVRGNKKHFLHDSDIRRTKQPNHDILLINDSSSVEDEMKYSVDSSIIDTTQSMTRKRCVSV
uniref:Ion_trans_2 domain-containing protein n=2 Tax=Trichobilharzia regenti TaxID=157069 RepID=A0AA85J6J3_TRIRE|nr:unnamed protein product [Trichobilharzia regenti]